METGDKNTYILNAKNSYKSGATYIDVFEKEFKPVDLDVALSNLRETVSELSGRIKEITDNYDENYRNKK